jgi:crossover junction endodeoxyribonuclease RuvC
MIILGIDPGTRITGYGCVSLNTRSIEPRLVEAGVLTFKRGESLESRLGELHASLAALIAELQPAHIAIEKLYAHYKHPRTAILMAHARGVILLAAQQAGLTIHHLPSTEVKKSITGHGHASKHQIQQAVMSQCRLKAPPSPPDVADAIAIALTAGRRLAAERLAAGR